MYPKKRSALFLYQNIGKDEEIRLFFCCLKTGGKMKKQKRCACGLCWLRKHKIILTLIAAAILVIISLRCPEYAENVAQAFVLLLAGV